MGGLALLTAMAGGAMAMGVAASKPWWAAGWETGSPLVWTLLAPVMAVGAWHGWGQTSVLAGLMAATRPVARWVAASLAGCLLSNLLIRWPRFWTHPGWSGYDWVFAALASGGLGAMLTATMSPNLEPDYPESAEIRAVAAAFISLGLLSPLLSTVVRRHHLGLDPFDADAWVLMAGSAGASATPYVLAACWSERVLLWSAVGTLLPPLAIVLMGYCTGMGIDLELAAAAWLYSAVGTGVVHIVRSVSTHGQPDAKVAELRERR
jgi:hypothetical protein